MSLTINPGKPAVTETRVLEAAVPATVTIEVSLHEALLLAAMQGSTTGSDPVTVHNGLYGHTLFRQYYDVVCDAIAFAYDTAFAYDSGADSQQSRNISLHAFRGRVDALRERAEESA